MLLEKHCKERASERVPLSETDRKSCGQTVLEDYVTLERMDAHCYTTDNCDISHTEKR